MDKMVSVKMPEELYAEFALRVPEGERSSFVRDAIVEKLAKTPSANKILNLEREVENLKNELSQIKRFLSDLDILTYNRGEVNPHTFCLDDVDRKIMDHLAHYKGATTPELSEAVGVNRWLILNRLRRLQKASERQLGKAVIQYYAGKKMGKKKAWWLIEDLSGKED